MQEYRLREEIRHSLLARNFNRDLKKISHRYGLSMETVMRLAAEILENEILVEY